MKRGVAQLAARVVWDDEVAGSSPVSPTNLNIANFASKQNISEFLKSLNWSQLLNKVRTYFERKILPLCVSAVLASRNQNKTILIPQPH